MRTRSTISNGQLTKLHTMLSQANLMDHKRELVRHYSNNRTESSRELTYSEAVDIIGHLESLATPAAVSKDQMEKMIKKMLYYGYQMGYDVARDNYQSSLEPKRICWINVEKWCHSKHCSINKDLKKYTHDELVKVLSQFEQVYKSFITTYQQ